MAKKPQKDDDDQRTPAETVKVRDATLKRMLATKPQPKKSKASGRTPKS